MAVDADVLLDWFSAHGRDLPWREPTCSAWGVLVSEIMLQQTPVVRVQPIWHEWMARWPVPSALAASSQGEVVRGDYRVKIRLVSLGLAEPPIAVRFAARLGPRAYAAVISLDRAEVDWEIVLKL